MWKGSGIEDTLMMQLLLYHTNFIKSFAFVAELQSLNCSYVPSLGIKLKYVVSKPPRIDVDFHPNIFIRQVVYPHNNRNRVRIVATYSMPLHLQHDPSASIFSQ